MQKDMSQIFRKGTKTLALRISQTTPDLTDSWNSQTYIHTWVQLIACLATVHSPLQEDQPTELPGPSRWETQRSRAHLLFIFSLDPCLRSSRLETN